jgi:hypothetical protein
MRRIRFWVGAVDAGWVFTRLRLLTHIHVAVKALKRRSLRFPHADQRQSLRIPIMSIIKVNEL